MKGKTMLLIFLSILLVSSLALAALGIMHMSDNQKEKEPNTSNTTTPPVIEEDVTRPNDDADAPTGDTEAETEPEEDIPEIVYYEYSGEIPHIFTHCLIAYPEVKAGDGNMLYDIDCINVTEFKNLLEELYANGYSLVDIHDTFYQNENGEYRWCETVEVPEGRKPFIFTIDDVVYDERKRGYGMVDFLALDENNDIVTGTYNDDGSITYSSENEFIPILEAFIEEHPDFSAHGARVTLCMTGFTGQFGYRTDADYTGDRASEIEKATAIANRLKEMGYTFACHGYGHYDATAISLGTMQRDIEQFKNEVVPVIGEVNVYVYPYGKNLSPSDAKYQELKDNGFALFCSVSHFFYSRDYEDGTSLYMTRMAVDGYSLRNYKEALSLLFDVDKVLDPTNRILE